MENIIRDLATLEIKPDMVTHTSDYFADIMKLTEEKLLKTGLAFVDDTDQMTMQSERLNRIESKRRNNTIEENMRMWGEMKKGSLEGLKVLMPAKLIANSVS